MNREQVDVSNGVKIEVCSHRSKTSELRRKKLMLAVNGSVCIVLFLVVGVFPTEPLGWVVLFLLTILEVATFRRWARSGPHENTISVERPATTDDP